MVFYTCGMCVQNIKQKVLTMDIQRKSYLDQFIVCKNDGIVVTTG